MELKPIVIKSNGYVRTRGMMLAPVTTPIYEEVANIRLMIAIENHDVYEVIQHESKEYHVKLTLDNYDKNNTGLVVKPKQVEAPKAKNEVVNNEPTTTETAKVEDRKEQQTDTNEKKKQHEQQKNKLIV